MTTQSITKTFNVSLHHEKPVDPVGPTDPTDGKTQNEETQLAVPNTGFQQYISQPTNLILPGIILVACILGVVLMIISRKNKYGRTFMVAGSSCLALAFGLAAPAAFQLSTALEQANANTTTLDITVGATDKTATSIAQLIAERDYPSGYTLSAYMTPSNALTDQSNTHQINSITSPSALNQFTQNSWGISGVDALSYSPISTDPTNPTQFYATDASTPAGTNINITYGINVNSTLPENVYTGTIHIILEGESLEPGTFDYAFWRAGATKDPVTGYYKMQDMTPSVCNAVYPPTSAYSGDERTTTLVDIRDGKTYTVGKLADGNCWMTDNLRLGSATDAITLTPASSDVSADFTLPASSSDWERGSIDNPQIYYDANNTGTSKDEVFYNFNAAVAGSADSTFVAGEAESSVCPKGWKLPTGSSAGQFNALYTTYDSDYEKMRTAFKFAFAGYFNPDNSQVENQNFFGFWWSSTLESNTNSYLLYTISFGSVYPSDANNRTFGGSVRCVAR